MICLKLLFASGNISDKTIYTANIGLPDINQPMMSERSEYISRLGNPTSNWATGRICFNRLVFDISFSFFRISSCVYVKTGL